MTTFDCDWIDTTPIYECLTDHTWAYTNSYISINSTIPRLAQAWLYTTNPTRVGYRAPMNFVECVRFPLGAHHRVMLALVFKP